MTYFILLVICLIIAEVAYFYYLAKTAKKPYIPDVTFTVSEEYKLKVFLKEKQEYLKSHLWETKRNKVLERDNYQCTVCGTTKRLEVHHDTGYSLIPYEPISCLRTVCRNCHQHIHDTYGYPQTLQEYQTFNTTPTIRI